MPGMPVRHQVQRAEAVSADHRAYDKGGGIGRAEGGGFSGGGAPCLGQPDRLKGEG